MVAGENGKNDLDSIRFSIEGHFIKRDIVFQESSTSGKKYKEKNLLLFFPLIVKWYFLQYT